MSNIKRPSTPSEIASHLGLRVEARATSTSGRWVSMLCEHNVKGLPCYDVLHVRTDGLIDRHHFGTVESEGSTYEESRDFAHTCARKQYEETVKLLQSKGSGEEADSQSAGLKIIGPDGREEDYRIN